MVAQADRVGLGLPVSFLWNLLKGDTPTDYIWFNVHRDIQAFGASADAWEVSGIGPAVSERFFPVSECVAGVSAASLIFQRGELPEAPMFITVSGCSYIHNTGREKLADIFESMGGIIKDMGDSAPIFTTALVPFTLRAPGSRDVLSQDVIIYSGFKNAAKWSNYLHEMFSTEAGQRLRNQMDMALDCGGPTLWSGQQAVGATK